MGYQQNIKLTEIHSTVVEYAKLLLTLTAVWLKQRHVVLIIA